MKLCWLDVRDVTEAKQEILEEAAHQRIDGVLAADPADLATLPPTVTRVLFPAGPLPDDLGAADVVILDPRVHGDAAAAARRHPDATFGRFVEIVDAETLDQACAAAREEEWSLFRFRDPTKIPLEIVLAAADRASGTIVTEVADVAEAEIVFGVLEHGSEGVSMAPTSVGDATRLKAAAAARTSDLALTELEVTGIEHIGMGDRVCVDTCSHFREDEGILVGSHSTGMILCSSETHPLPYMPTRPFRVNAGALHSYTASVNERTNYLSELRSGSTMLAVDSKGRTRSVVVGRAKLETRPLLSIDAAGPGGERVNLIVQDDWHVRVLGPSGAVLNVTELAPGSRVLGYLPTEKRHVGYPIEEFCLER